jgi:hypothetical protein
LSIFASLWDNISFTTLRYMPQTIGVSPPWCDMTDFYCSL